jgi:hypothetical protein
MGPNPKLELPQKRRLELGTACAFLEHYNDERNCWYAIPDEELRADDRQDSFGVDIVAVATNARQQILEPREELKLQVKGIHIERAVARWKEGRMVATEQAVGEAAAQRQDEDNEQIRKVFPEAIQKIASKDYSDAIVLFYINGETATQTTIEELIESHGKGIKAIKAREVWFIQDIPIMQAEGLQRACTVYKLMGVTPRRTSHFCHVRYA